MSTERDDDTTDPTTRREAPERPVHGLLAVVRGMTAFTGGDLDIAAVAGRRALEWAPPSAFPIFRRWGCIWRVGP